MILDIKNLNVAYHQKQGYFSALKNVSFNLLEGEILGIVGESGSGKSTIALSLLNLLPFDAEKTGEILFYNNDLFSFSEEDFVKLRGAEIGLIFQEPASSFNPVLTIDYQFREVLACRRKIRDRKLQKDIIQNSLEKVYLKDYPRTLRSYPHQLSGGELQRVAIAIAIALKPKLLIADEPTSSLDVTIESQIIYLFKELRKDLRIPIIFITHNLGLVKVLCDKVLVLCDGVVKEISKTEDLFSSPQDTYTKELVTSFKKLC